MKLLDQLTDPQFLRYVKYLLWYVAQNNNCFDGDKRNLEKIV